MKKLKLNILDNRIFHIAMNILSSVVLVFSIVICAVVIVSSKSQSGLPNFAGYYFLSVQSDSMEPVFYEGDLIVVKNDGKKDEYAVKDIITFYAYDNFGNKFFNTHRIKEVKDTNGFISYVTKGDNADKQDKNPVDYNRVVGLYTGTRIKNLGSFFDFAETSQGVMLLIVLPAALIVIWQLFGYLRSLALDKRAVVQTVQQANSAPSPMPQPYPPAAQSEKDAIIKEYLQKQREEEARKQQIIEEYLEQQRQLEQAEKEKAEEAKIKAIIAEFLAQQKAAEENGENKSDSEN